MQQGERGVARLAARVDAVSVRYQRAEADLTSLVARAVLGGTLGLPSMQRAIRAQTRTMMQELNDKGIPEAQVIIEQAYQLGLRLAASEVHMTSGINAEAVTLLKDNIAHRLGDATTHVGRRVDDVFRKEGLRQAALALADNAQPDLGVNMQRRLVQQGVSAFTDTLGRSWGLGDYARMAVKTITAESVFTATSTTLIANRLDVVDVNSVANPCDICFPYDGGTYSLTGANPDYPLLDTTFPIHPHCDHFITVAREAFPARSAA